MAALRSTFDTTSESKIELDQVTLLSHYPNTTAPTYEFSFNSKYLSFQSPGLAQLFFSQTKKTTIFQQNKYLGTGTDVVWQFSNDTDSIAIKYILKPDETTVAKEAIINMRYNQIGGYSMTKEYAVLVMKFEPGKPGRYYFSALWDHYLTFCLHFTIALKELHAFAFHRDLHWYNYLVFEDKPRIIDFGCAVLKESGNEYLATNDKRDLQNHLLESRPKEIKEDLPNLVFRLDCIIHAIPYLPLEQIQEALEILIKEYAAKNISPSNLPLQMCLFAPKPEKKASVDYDMDLLKRLNELEKKDLILCMQKTSNNTVVVYYADGVIGIFELNSLKKLGIFKIEMEVNQLLVDDNENIILKKFNNDIIIFYITKKDKINLDYEFKPEPSLLSRSLFDEILFTTLVPSNYLATATKDTIEVFDLSNCESVLVFSHNGVTSEEAVKQLVKEQLVSHKTITGSANPGNIIHLEKMDQTEAYKSVFLHKDFR